MKEKYAAFLIVFIILLPAFGCQKEIKMDKEFWLNKFSQSIQVGSKYQDVESFFMLNNIEYSFVASEGRFYGMYKTKNKASIVQKNVFFIVDIGANGTVTEYLIKPSYVGP